MAKNDALFDELNNIFEKRTPPNDTKNTFMLQRFLSMSNKGFWAASLANMFAAKLPGWAYLRLMHSIVPTTNPPRGAYIKALLQNKWSSDLIDHLTRHLCCNVAHAINTAELLQAQGVDPYTIFGLAPPKGSKDGKDISSSKIAGREVRTTSRRKTKK